MPRANMEEVLFFQIPFPPLDEQKRIVAKLDQLLDLDVQRTKLISEQYSHANAWLKSMHSGLMEPDDSWEKHRLGAIAEIFDGPHATPEKTSDGPWYLSISSLSDGTVDLSKSAHISWSDFPKWTKRTSVKFGDTLFSYETRLGQAAIWDRHDEAAVGRRMAVLRPREHVVPKFLTELFLSKVFQREIKLRTSKGTTVDRIPIAAMAEWVIGIPSLPVQIFILKQIEDLRSKMNNLNTVLEQKTIEQSLFRAASVASVFRDES